MYSYVGGRQYILYNFGGAGRVRIGPSKEILLVAWHSARLGGRRGCCLVLCNPTAGVVIVLKSNPNLRAVNQVRPEAVQNTVSVFSKLQVSSIVINSLTAHLMYLSDYFLGTVIFNLT